MIRQIRTCSAPAGRGLVVAAGLVLGWWALAVFLDIPAYILPAPPRVAVALWTGRTHLAHQALVTIAEMLAGLALGLACGLALAIAMALSPRLQRWLMPVLVLSQAIPVFALAPLLVLWLGYGVWSKAVAAALVIFFPVTATLQDGLGQTATGFLELAQTMGASRHAQLRHVRLVAALPVLASGMRVAAATAPIGTILGEWVGAADGLGHVMLESIARLRMDDCFAALLLICLIGIGLFVTVDTALKRLIFWVPDSTRHQPGPQS